MAGNAWETMEQGALWALEHSRELSPNSAVEGMGPVLRLWTYSLEGKYSSWTILVPMGSEEQSRPFVREVVWKRRQDERRLASVNQKHKLRTRLQSTIQVRDAEVSSEDLDPFLKAVARLFVPAISLGEPPPEGDVSGFEGYRSLAYLRMQWQGPGPVEWAATVAWVASLRGLLVASLREREKAGG